MTGTMVNTCSLILSLPDYKHTIIVDLLQEWRDKRLYTLLEAATLVGHLESATQVNRWGHVWFLTLRAALRTAIKQRYHTLAYQYKKYPERWKYLNQPIPPHMMDRLESIAAQEVARVV